MMTVKELREYLNQLDPSYDEVPVVQHNLGHSYCGVGFKFIEAARVPGYLGELLHELSEYLPSNRVKVKVLLAS